MSYMQKNANFLLYSQHVFLAAWRCVFPHLSSFHFLQKNSSVLTVGRFEKLNELINLFPALGELNTLPW